MGSVESRDDAERIRVLAFDLEGKRYCVRADSVASVFSVGGEGAVATGDDPWNAGRVSVSGTPVRVVDLPRAFTSSTPTAERVDAPKLLAFATPDADETVLLDERALHG